MIYNIFQVLTLASNERVPLTSSMRLVFEISHLRTATPATVSRAGILYINHQDLGWNLWVKLCSHTIRVFNPVLYFYFLLLNLLLLKHQSDYVKLCRLPVQVHWTQKTLIQILIGSAQCYKMIAWIVAQVRCQLDWPKRTPDRKGPPHHTVWKICSAMYRSDEKNLQDHHSYSRKLHGAGMTDRQTNKQRSMQCLALVQSACHMFLFLFRHSAPCLTAF